MRIEPVAGLPAVRRQLRRAAARSHLAASPISSSVLDPADLEELEPDLVAALPAGTGPAAASRLLRLTKEHSHRIGMSIPASGVLPVLVHDLRFTLRTAHPAAMAQAIAREGILADALGNYTVGLGRRRLAISYTGPLLSDHLLRSVRRGIARPPHVPPGRVSVAPRSATGSGVDMTTEPAPPPAFSPAPTGHHHHH